MNKNVKRIIAITLAIGAFAAVGPTKYTSFFTTAAHASSSDADELTSLDLETSGGSSIDLYEDSSYDDQLSDDLSVGDTYYAKTSASKVVISDIDGADEDKVRIFKSGSTKAYEVGDSISITGGTQTTLKVRVYEDDYDEDEDYSSSEYNQYTIVVKNTSEDDADLLGIALSTGFIAFNTNTTSYDVSVPSDATTITVKAVPKDEDYTVKIDGTTVDKDDSYSKTVTLDTDSTTDSIPVIVSSDDDSKTYTLNITKTSTTNNSGMYNQQGNGNGNGFGNQNGNQFGNGNMNNGNMFNMGIGNSSTSGWKQSGSSWYYTDNSGQKKTGWFQDTDGKWYYLDASGVMASNTIINGYKLGSDGAWIK